ncbi:hypothetical protein UPYG_G00214480 [Umbra pygmaea]|uniref:Uncharacterized protein n=1 Tax=Umbra pygmaea TaxID=75934 RepID=A0ABD0WLE8_UMBPY
MPDAPYRPLRGSARLCWKKGILTFLFHRTNSRFSSQKRCPWQSQRGRRWLKKETCLQVSRLLFGSHWRTFSGHLVLWRSSSPDIVQENATVGMTFVTSPLLQPISHQPETLSNGQQGCGGGFPVRGW